MTSIYNHKKYEQARERHDSLQLLRCHLSRYDFLHPDFEEINDEVEE